MKKYFAARGFRDVDGRVFVQEVTPDGPHERVIGHRLKLNTPTGSSYPRSPDGHAWGYGGSAPSQLALDVLWDLFGKEPLPYLYQRFKDGVIANLPQDEGFELTEERIREWIRASAPRWDANERVFWFVSERDEYDQAHETADQPG